MSSEAESGVHPYAVILAGGSASRLGGVDKPALPVGGIALLDRVLAAVPDPWGVVVVGPRRRTVRAVAWTQEQPPGAGPVAGLRAGLVSVHGARVVLLAADLPFLTRQALHDLVDASSAESGAIAVDDADRPQWLLSAWPAGMLRDAAAAATDDASLRSVLQPLPHTGVRLRAADAPPWFDCDSAADLKTARRMDDAG